MLNLVEGKKMTGPKIEANNLSKRYGDVEAVSSLSFAVGQGEVFGFLGRNGSGKTTTVRMLTTLLTPTSGTASVDGFDVLENPQKVRESSGVTLQEATLDPKMTGQEHLDLMGQLLGHSKAATRQRSSELLESFGLQDAASKLIRTYSGGMQRRLDIATALFSRPPVLFLDEPTTGLDPQSRRALWSEIRTLGSSGTTVFLTTQYLEEADQLADRLIILDRGVNIAEGTPEGLRSQFGTQIVTLPGTQHVDALDRTFDEGAASVENGQTKVQVPLSYSTENTLNVLREVTGSLDGISITKASLEDVFVSLTGTEINASAEASAEVAA